MKRGGRAQGKLEYGDRVELEKNGWERHKTKCSGPKKQRGTQTHEKNKTAVHEQTLRTRYEDGENENSKPKSKNWHCSEGGGKGGGGGGQQGVSEVLVKGGRKKI